LLHIQPTAKWWYTIISPVSRRDVSINRLQAASADYRPIPIIIYLFSVLNNWVIKSKKSNRITRFNKILLLWCNSLQYILQSLHGNKFKLSLHFPVSKVYHRFPQLLVLPCYALAKPINRYRPIIGRLFGTDNRPADNRPKYISSVKFAWTLSRSSIIYWGAPRRSLENRIVLLPAMRDHNTQDGRLVYHAINILRYTRQWSHKSNTLRLELVIYSLYYLSQIFKLVIDVYPTIYDVILRWMRYIYK